MRKAGFATLAILVWCAVLSPMRAGEVRNEVATLDGAPVYHWRPFKSIMQDDVDRALILREFQRKSFKLPPKLVNDSVQREITDNYGGKNDKFLESLHQKGASLEDFRSFTTEEIMIGAMLYQKTKNPADEARLQAEGLAKLRKGATIKRLPAK